MTESFWLNVLIVVAANLLAAWCWVAYFRAATNNQPAKAALADCAIIAIHMGNVMGAVKDHRLILPVLLAAYVGTYSAVRWGRQ